MKVNYLFGNGFSISLNTKYKYDKLLNGFVNKFYTRTKIRLPHEIEQNPEVYIGQMINKANTKKRLELLLVLQYELRVFIINRLRKMPIPAEKGELEHVYNTATTNYDLNAENVFSISGVTHMHGSIMSPESILFASAEVKQTFLKEGGSIIDLYDGELRIFGLKPNYDDHIWSAISKNRRITKVLVSYFSDEDHKSIKALKLKNDKYEPIQYNDAKKKWFKL